MVKSDEIAELKANIDEVSNNQDIPAAPNNSSASDASFNTESSSVPKTPVQKKEVVSRPRIPTGIPGLDEMIEGGFKKKSSVLIVGGCGSGKSTFSMQYLTNGVRAGEPGVYVTFEESPDEMKENFNRYEWGLEGLERDGKLKIVRIRPAEVKNLVDRGYGDIVNAINEIEAQRVVIDSISTIEMMMQDPYESRVSILKLCEWLKKHGCTSLIVSETEQIPTKYSKHGIIEFVVDGVIVLYNLQEKSWRHNAIEILKMRGTQHAKKIVPFKFQQGITVFPAEEVF